MIERLALLVAFALFIAAAVFVARWWAGQRLRTLQLSASRSLWQSLGVGLDERPMLIAFSSPLCGVCRTAQEPAIDRLESTLGSNAVRVVKIDVASNPEVADAFGVLTVPTTVVLTPRGNVLTANNGFAPFPRLVEQVQAARAS